MDEKRFHKPAQGQLFYVTLRKKIRSLQIGDSAPIWLTSGKGARELCTIPGRFTRSYRENEEGLWFGRVEIVDKNILKIKLTGAADANLLIEIPVRYKTKCYMEFLLFPRSREGAASKGTERSGRGENNKGPARSADPCRRDFLWFGFIRNDCIPVYPGKLRRSE